MDHRQLLKQAVDMACENVRSGRGGPFAAIIVLDGEVIGRGVNEVTEMKDPTAHAEIQAIRQACQRLQTGRLDSADPVCQRRAVSHVHRRHLLGGIKAVYVACSTQELLRPVIPTASPAIIRTSGSRRKNGPFPFRPSLSKGILSRSGFGKSLPDPIDPETATKIPVSFRETGIANMPSAAKGFRRQPLMNDVFPPVFQGLYAVPPVPSPAPGRHNFRRRRQRLFRLRSGTPEHRG